MLMLRAGERRKRHIVLGLVCTLFSVGALEAQRPSRRSAPRRPTLESREYEILFDKVRDDPAAFRSLQRFLIDPCAQLNTRSGFVEMDLPWSVAPNEEFTADVSIQPCKDTPLAIVEVRM